MHSGAALAIPGIPRVSAAAAPAPKADRTDLRDETRSEEESSKSSRMGGWFTFPIVFTAGGEGRTEKDEAPATSRARARERGIECGAIVRCVLHKPFHNC